MTHKTKHQKKKVVQVFISYIIHIWFIIFISNVVIFFGFRYFLMASESPTAGIDEAYTEIVETQEELPTNIPADITLTPEIDMPTENELTPSSATPSAEIVEPTIAEPTATPTDSPTPTLVPPTPTPKGPVINLNLSMPGIGTMGGNLNPERPVREVSLFFYHPDANISDKTVRPLHVIRTYVIYDSEPNSPTYTQFVNNYIDLGSELVKQRFQIGVKAPQTMVQVIKDTNSRSLGGKIFIFESTGRQFWIPHQNMITGDIFPIPTTDGIMDINDYNMLRNCYGLTQKDEKCLSKAMADLDDNGVVDGLDYNLMLLSFQTLKSMGYPIPRLDEKPKIVINPSSITPSLKPTLAASPTPSPIKTATQASSGGPNFIIILFVFLLIVGILVFGAYKLHLLDKYLVKGTTPPSTSPEPKTTEQPQAAPEQSVTPGQAQTIFEPTASLTQTEKPPPSNPQENNPPAASQTEATKIAKPNVDVVERTGFIKKVMVDTAKEGVWVTIADDNGITQGFYKNPDVTEGFSKVKGIMRTDESNKPYMEILEISNE